MYITGADPLLCLLHETAGSDENISPNQLQEIPSVWRYRTYITTEHLKREFESKIISEKGQTKQVILQMFLNQVNYAI